MYPSPPLIIPGILFLSLAFSGYASAPTATVETISLDAATTAQTAKEFALPEPLPAGAATVIIQVDIDHPAQTMDGVGGAFNELGWDALSALPETRRQESLRALFDTQTGAGLGFNRLPIGASDFARNLYSYDDEKDDYDLAHFSIRRDEGSLIPYIKAAQEINPAMKFFGSPWTPPLWMKRDITPGHGGVLKKDKRTLESYGAYFVKYLEAYAGHAIMLERLCPQNEFMHQRAITTCLISTPLFIRATRDYVIPAIKKAGLKTEVWAGTICVSDPSTRQAFDPLLAAPAFWNDVRGVSFQYSHWAWVREFHEKYPLVPIQFSETTCDNGENTPAQAVSDFANFIAYTRMGCRLFAFWNMVLPEPCKNLWGWRQNSLVVIDKAKQTVTYEPSFALATFLGRHDIPGARYLPATAVTGDAGIGILHARPEFFEGNVEKHAQVVAFQKPNGKIVVYLMNQGPQARAQIKIGDKTTVETVLPASALCAVVVSGS